MSNADVRATARIVADVPPEIKEKLLAISGKRGATATLIRLIEEEHKKLKGEG